MIEFVPIDNIGEMQRMERMDRMSRMGEEKQYAVNAEDASFLDIFQHMFDLGCRTCPADIFNPAREILEPFFECLEMLEGQYGCRDQYSYLFIV